MQTAVETRFTKTFVRLRRLKKMPYQEQNVMLTIHSSTPLRSGFVCVNLVLYQILSLSE